MTKYTDTQKREALELYVVHGTAETARRTGIPVRTIGRWVKDADAVAYAAPKKAIEASRLRNEDRRLRLRELLLLKGVELLEAMDANDARAAKDLSIAVGVLLDKYRLEAGEVTDRRETVSSELDSELQRLVGKLKDNDPVSVG